MSFIRLHSFCGCVAYGGFFLALNPCEDAGSFSLMYLDEHADHAAFSGLRLARCAKAEGGF